MKISYSLLLYVIESQCHHSHLENGESEEHRILTNGESF